MNILLEKRTKKNTKEFIKKIKEIYNDQNIRLSLDIPIDLSDIFFEESVVSKVCSRTYKNKFFFDFKFLSDVLLQTIPKDQVDIIMEYTLNKFKKYSIFLNIENGFCVFSSINNEQYRPITKKNLLDNMEFFKNFNDKVVPVGNNYYDYTDTILKNYMYNTLTKKLEIPFTFPIIEKDIIKIAEFNILEYVEDSLKETSIMNIINNFKS